MKQNTNTERSLRRRLAIIALLHMRPYRYTQLVQALAERDLLPTDSHDEQLDKSRRILDIFQDDRQALVLLGYDIRHDRQTHLYTLHNSPFGLSLDESELEAFAIVLDTFAHATIPPAAAIHSLLRRLASLLPEPQQQTVQRSHPFIIDLRETTDYRTADRHNISVIEKAIQRGQQLEFEYRSPSHTEVKRHTVEPRPLVYKDGHVYLPIYSVVINKEFEVRLDRIVPSSAHMLPKLAMPSRPRTATYQLRYTLSPELARLGVSQHFPQQLVEMHHDGAATITAEVTDLFATRRILLAYGKHCTVLAPSKLIEDIHDHVAALYQIYHKPNELG